MNKAVLKKPPQVNPVQVSFKIDDGVSIPARHKDVPNYGLMELFAGMIPGQSVLLSYADIPVAHARLYVQRFARKGRNGPDGLPIETEMVTRQESGANGDASGLRVWRGE